MRFIRFSVLGVPLMLGVLLAAVFVPSPLLAETTGDTLTVDEGTKPEGAVRIKIDESGIRIEGGVAEDEDTTSERRIIFDSRTGNVRPRGYREKGTDIVKFGEDVHVESDELVRGDLVVFGGDVVVEGKVVGNVVVMAGNAHIVSGAEVNGDVVVIGGTLQEDPEVLIHGERVEFQNLSVSLQTFSNFFGSHSRFFGFFLVPLQFFVSVMLSFLIVLFLRARVVKMQDQVQAGVLKSFGAGFLVVFVGTFVVCFLTIVLLITLIGIPLALVLIVSCVAIFIIARTVFVYALGVKVNEVLKIQSQNPFAIVLVGTATLYVPALLGYGISVLPFGVAIGAIFKLIGWAIGVFAYLVGLGALFLTRFGGRGAVPAPAAAPVQSPE